MSIECQRKYGCSNGGNAMQTSQKIGRWWPVTTIWRSSIMHANTCARKETNSQLSGSRHTQPMIQMQRHVCKFVRKCTYANAYVCKCACISGIQCVCSMGLFDVVTILGFDVIAHMDSRAGECTSCRAGHKRSAWRQL